MKIKIMLLVILFISSKMMAQVTTNSGSGLAASYASMADAITALNSATITSPVVITLQANETAPSTGYVITATGTSTNTIVIQGGGDTVTAGTGYTAGSLTDAIFKLRGSDWVTIENFVMQENPANTVTAEASNTMTEWGVALLYATTTNGAQNCTIQNNTISLSLNYAASFGIYSNSAHSATAVTLSSAGANGANNNLKIYGNAIRDARKSILVVGPTSAANFQTGLDIGGTSAVTGNRLTNFGGVGSNSFAGITFGGTTAAGIYIANCKDANISYNTLISTDGSVAYAAGLNGIINYTTSAAPTGTYTTTINNNSIDLRSGGSTQSVNGIQMSLGAMSNASSLYISCNKFTNLTQVQPSASGAIYGINTTTPALNTTINGNVFDIRSVASTSGGLIFISANYIMPAGGSKTVNNNSNKGPFNYISSSGTVRVYYDASNSPAGSTHQFNNNHFSNITVTGTTFIKMFENTGGGDKTISGNVFDSLISTGSYSPNIYGFIYGNANSCLISGNIISNIIANCPIIGIFTSTTTGKAIIRGNTIKTLRCSAISSSSLYGIWITGGDTTVIEKNSIADLQYFSVISGQVRGINIGGTPVDVTLQNNLIGYLSAPNFNDLSTNVIGIQVAGAAGTRRKLYFNSVYLNATSTGTNFSTAAVYSGVVSDLIMRNNIFVNLSTANGTGKTVAFLGNADSTLNYYNSVSNRNLFYAGTPSAGNVIYSGTNSYQTLANFQTLLANSRDAQSITENPTFLSTNPADVNFLHIDPTVATGINGGADVLAGITDDFDGDTRSGTPDIGADEFSPRVTPCTPPVAAVTASGSTAICICNSVTLTASGGTSYRWNRGQTGAAITVSSPGTYTAIVTNGDGCRATASATVSVITTIIPDTTIKTAVDSYTWSVNGQTYTQSGVYNYSSGCDFKVLVLNIQSISTPTVNSTGALTSFIYCPGTASSIQTFTVSGLGLSDDITITAPTGFEIRKTGDSLFTSSITLADSAGTVRVSSIDIRVATSASGPLTDSVSIASTGATTVYVAATATVLSSSQVVSDTACGFYTWDVTGMVYTESGTYTGTSGCVNHTLNLFMYPADALNMDTVTICGSYTWPFNGQTYTQSGIYYEASDGCSFDALLLTITTGGGTVSSVSATGCDSYTWALNNTDYTQSGTYTNVTGCDTTYLSLTITASTSTKDTITACGVSSYTWPANGVTYTESGFYYYDGPGCQFHSLILTISASPGVTTTNTVSTCDSYFWNDDGNTYTQSGTYTALLGCDTSIIVLTIAPSSSHTESVTACGSYLWAADGQTYTQSGTYTTLNGCVTDSLILTVNSLPNVTCPADQTMCQGMLPFDLRGLFEGTISSLNCQNATLNGTLKVNTAASGVSIQVPYTNGNGGYFAGRTDTSTGVTGLTATLTAGVFAGGNGSLNFAITGTPSAAGTASFDITVAGFSCTLNATVNAAFTCGVSTVTFVYRGNTVTYGTVVGRAGQCWLDRNLGASRKATSSSDASAYGDLFQWGRLDDGHQDRNSGTTSTQSATDTPGHGNFITTIGDWRSAPNNSLWQGLNGTNNPCPCGYRIPTEAELTAEKNLWSPQTLAGAYGSPLKIPAGGLRLNSSGSLSNVGVGARLWTYNYTSDYNARGLNITTSTIAFTNNSRGYGITVRCIKDASNPDCSGGTQPIAVVPINNPATAPVPAPTGTVSFSGTGVSGNSFLAAPGTYPITYTYTDGNGCSNSCTFNFTVTANNVLSADTVSSCDSYYWGADSTTYTQSGTYSKTNGCNSQVLELTVTPSSHSNVSASACGSYTWSVDGNTYTQSGTYTSVIGCATDTLVLTINSVPVVSCPQDQTVCTGNMPLDLTSLLPGSVSSLNCAGAVITGALTDGQTAGAVSAAISYTGGNGGSHSGQIVSSTGVTGLTATLLPGTFASGSGTITYNITGTPSGLGTASFAINIGGSTCSLDLAVNSAFACGTDSVTFVYYNGVTVTYGTIPGANNQCWLDRNLGALRVATSTTDADAYGDLFQWGRGADGHQLRTSATTTTQSATDNPGNSSFIINTYNWQNPVNSLLWNGTEGINNPCPTGFRVPTQAEWDTERASWSPQNVTGAYTALKLTLSGLRRGTDAANPSNGSDASYWSSTFVSTNYSNSLYLHPSLAMSGTNLYSIHTHGEAVRCIRDNSGIDRSYVPISMPAQPLPPAPSGTGVFSGTGVSGGSFNAGPGVYNITYTYTTAAGCSDSCTFTLTVNEPTIDSSNVTACDSYYWGADSVTYTQSGTYSKLSGCVNYVMNLAVITSTTYYRDSDGDGYGNIDSTTQSCDGVPEGYADNSDDCDDTNAEVNPETVWYKDADNDGYSDGVTLHQCTKPADYQLPSNLADTTGDCDDSDPVLNPATIWYKDMDNDGYGSGDSLIQCTQPAGYKLADSLTATRGDCNDNNPALNVPAPVSVTITASPSGPVCAGVPVTFTATVVNGGTAPLYGWRINGVAVGGTCCPTYTTSGLNEGDSVWCVVTSNSPCVINNPAKSNVIGMSLIARVTPSVSIAASPSNAICQGTAVTFTATPVNGGPTPTYQWKLNGVNVGINSPTFTSSTLANGNIVTCLMTTSLSCVTYGTAQSNSITMAVTKALTPTVSISASPSATICPGGSVTFIASIVNGGSTPTYQWKINGANVGTNSSIFTASAPSDGDVVTCELTTSLLCVTNTTATSNAITVTVLQVVTPSVSITASPSTTACSGTYVTFTANVVNGGTSNTYVWKVNGVTVGSNSATYKYKPLNGDQVWCVVTVNRPCVTTPMAGSNVIVMTIIPSVNSSVTITAGSSTTVCANTPVTFTATVVNGGTSPTYQWKINGVNVGTNSSTFTWSSWVSGDKVTCMITTNNICTNYPTATSNYISMTVSALVTPSVSITASPSATIGAGTTVNFTATPVNGGTPVYQWKLNGVNVGTNSNRYSSSTLGNGDRVSVEMRSSLGCVTANPVTSNIISITVAPPCLEKFITVDINADKSYRYDSAFNLLSSSALNINNKYSNDVTWLDSNYLVIDKNGKMVYRYNPAGSSVASRVLAETTGYSLSNPNGLALIGDELWVVDGSRKKLYLYSYAAAFNGTTTVLNAQVMFALNSLNAYADGLATDGTYLYVVDDKTKQVFRYQRTSPYTSVASKVMKDLTATAPGTLTGITLEGGFAWIVDNGKDRAYKYSLTDLFAGTGNILPLAQFSLNTGNGYATGIALIKYPPAAGKALPQAAPATREEAGIVTAYPNPFRDQIRFRIVAPSTGKGKLQLLDFQGKLLQEVLDANLQKGVPVDISVPVRESMRIPMIYYFIQGDNRYRGKLLPGK